MDLSKYLPTEELKAEFAKFKSLQTEEDRQSFKEERIKKFESKTETEQKAYIENSRLGLNNAVEESVLLIETVNLGEVSNIISVSYIAQKYFGKTRQWLYQKLNGNIVNGKPAGFTDEEKKKLKEALLDISNVITNTSLKIA
jgi:hypothetical protein